MSFGSMHVPPKEHRERKPFQAFTNSNELRKANATKQGTPHIRPTEEDWLQTVKSEKRWLQIRAILFFVLFLLLTFLVVVALKQRG